MCTDNRFEWTAFASVKESNIKITGVYHTGYDGIFRYVDDLDRCGFMTKERILTKPLYTAHVVPKDPENGLFAVTMASGLINTLVLIDFKRRCEMLHFAASFWLDKEQGLLAYRIDEATKKWPRNMSWGVFDVKARKVVLAPRTVIPCIDGSKGMSVEEKLRRRIAS